jgi:anti-sigma factor RsiW
MTDARQPIAACPDFESLSCYADGELDAAGAAAVASHVRDCAHCETVALRLHDGFEADGARRGGGIGGSGCGGEERLVLYATGGLRGDERHHLEKHLATCDPCVGALGMLHRRLSVASVVDVPVPDGLRQRAHVALDEGLRELAAEVVPARPATTPGAALLQRVGSWLRIPVLIPVAAAATALLVVALQPAHNDPTNLGERSRAVAPAASKLRVTAVEASVRSRPSMQSEVVGTVHRGALVEVAGEERDWYQVQVDGRPGWVEREAFE